MKLPQCLLILNLSITCGLSQAQQPLDHSFQQDLTLLRQKDDVENYTYAFVDEYLKQPTEKNLDLFTVYEKERWRPLTSREEYLAYVVLLCNQGYYLTQYGNVYEGINAYEKASQVFTDQALTDFDIIEYCLKPLGNNYSMLGDYASASNIVKNYLYRAEQQQNSEQRISAYINLSVIYHDTGEYLQAIQLLQQALTLPALPAEKKMLVYYNLARNYADLREFTKSRQCAERAMSIFEHHGWPDTLPTLVNVYALLSAVSLAEGQSETALSWIEKAQALATDNHKLFKNRELVKLANTHAGILTARGQYREALAKYQRSFAWLLPRYDPAKSELPEAAWFYAENAIKETLDGMAEVYAKLNDPTKALACHTLRFEAEDRLRDTYNYEEAKLLQQAENRNATEKALELLYALFEKTKDGGYAIDAFLFAERTKAMILRENAEDRQWLQHQEQDVLVKEERRLRYKQSIIASEIAAEQIKQEQADVAYIHQRTTQQTKNALALKELSRALEEKYPQRIPTNIFDEKVLQTMLRLLEKDQATIVEYFFGVRALYILKVDGHTVRMHRVEAVETLKQDVLALHDLFVDPSAINNQVERYKEMAFDLAGALQLTGAFETSRLMIVPDGVLNLVPFDALLYEKASGTIYEDFPWLHKKYTIAYQPSASIYACSERRPAALHRKGVLGVFPVFEGSALQLDYSIQEAEDIRNETEGMFLFNQAATQRAFLEQAERFQIIHLSTHASSGTGAAPPSIMFSDSTLYLPRIYGLNLKADLVVLSACETGVGVLVKGEGAMSLAHGFQFSGIRNAIFSLWKVNDNSTAALMGDFYRRYFADGNKAEALRLARQDYLSDEAISNASKSPYYWAGFVYYGSLETQPVDATFPSLLVVSLIVFLLAIVAGIYWVYRRNQKATT